MRAGEVVVDSVFDDDVTDASFLPAMESQVDMPHDVGQAAPITPPMSSMQLPPKPRQPHSTRLHDDDTNVEQDAKKAETEQQKKQRLNQIMQFNESMIRVVTVGSDEFATMDDYTTELNMEDDIAEDELWADEDQVNLTDVPDALWSDEPLDKSPAAPPDWIDKLADEVEINRLLSMGVLQRKAESNLEQVGTLTTRFVYDWRKKMHKSGVEKWMRRSRFVAREFASEKRNDTYAPATGCHTSNLTPLIYLKMLGDEPDESCNSSSYKATLASLDIKDAFLQVPQDRVIGVELYGAEYLVLRNLPGQRLGAKAWYWHFRNYVSEVLKCCWCAEQPCIGKCIVDGVHNTFIIHVDDLLFAGSHDFWVNRFLPAMTFKVQHKLQ